MQSVDNGLSSVYRVDRSRLAPWAERVAQVLTAAEPEQPLARPWSQLDMAHLRAALAPLDKLEQARSAIDLAVVTLLVGVHPGVRWRYAAQEPLSPAALASSASADDLLTLLDQAGKVDEPAKPAAVSDPDDKPSAPAAPAAAAASRSTDDAETPGPAQLAQPGSRDKAALTGEAGLTAAVYRAFMAGAFSSHPDHPERADASSLRHLDTAALRAVLQGSAANPVLGLESRAAVLAALGGVLQNLQVPAAQADLGPARPAHLLDRWISQARTPGVLSARDVLGDLLQLLAPVWVSGGRIQGLPAGDAWPHRFAGDAMSAHTKPGGGQQDLHRGTGDAVPLHALARKLVQALAWPLQHAGWPLTGLDELGPVADRASTTWLLSSGVLQPRQASMLARTHRLQDDAIVEARAVAACLLDELATAVRQQLGRTAEELPLSTIEAACPAAMGLSATALKTDSDGTLF